MDDQNHLYFESDGCIRDELDMAVGNITLTSSLPLSRVRAVFNADNIAKLFKTGLTDLSAAISESAPLYQSVPNRTCLDVAPNSPPAPTRSPQELQHQLQKLLELQKTIPAQRTPGWYAMREQCLTASDLAGAIGESKYDKPFDILAKKCGGGKPFTGNVHTAWGQKYEPLATAIFEAKNGVHVLEFGLMPHMSISWLAASPDGIVAETQEMLEIKVLFSHFCAFTALC